MEDHNGPLLNLVHAAPEIIITNILCYMPLRDRFNCALVCKAWAEAATPATHSIILEHRIQNLSGLQHWLEQHGRRLEVLQLHECDGAALTALPCPQLQDLLLHSAFGDAVCLNISSRVWCDLVAATKISSVSLSDVFTLSQQADVVAALTALPNLEQLTWLDVCCSGQEELSDSLLLQQMRLTFLELQDVTAAALQHLGSLTKLQHLSISAADDWAAAGCPGLQELKALTSLKLNITDLVDLPASISQLTALQQLEVWQATPTALNWLLVLTVLTQLRVWQVTGLSAESPPLKLPGLQHLELFDNDVDFMMPMSYLASCTQLQYLRLYGFELKGPGSLVASTMLQHLELNHCGIAAADGAADPVSWQQVFPGQLPHLTYLQLWPEEPALQQAEIEALVACCSNLKALGSHRPHSSLTPALARLPGLTSLQVHTATDEQCSTLIQLTGLRQLTVMVPWEVSAVGLRQLAGLEQLTSLGLGKLSCINLNNLARLLMQDNLPGCAHALINKVCGTHLYVLGGGGACCSAAPRRVRAPCRSLKTTDMVITTHWHVIATLWAITAAVEPTLYCVRRCRHGLCFGCLIRVLQVVGEAF